MVEFRRIEGGWVEDESEEVVAVDSVVPVRVG